MYKKAICLFMSLTADPGRAAKGTGGCTERPHRTLCASAGEYCCLQASAALSRLNIKDVLQNDADSHAADDFSQAAASNITQSDKQRQKQHLVCVHRGIAHADFPALAVAHSKLRPKLCVSRTLCP